MSANRTETSLTSGTPRASLWDSEVARIRLVTCGDRKRPRRSRFFSSATIFCVEPAALHGHGGVVGERREQVEVVAREAVGEHRGVDVDDPDHLVLVPERRAHGALDAVEADRVAGAEARVDLGVRGQDRDPVLEHPIGDRLGDHDRLLAGPAARVTELLDHGHEPARRRPRRSASASRGRPACSRRRCPSPAAGPLPRAARRSGSRPPWSGPSGCGWTSRSPGRRAEPPLPARPPSLAPPSSASQQLRQLADAADDRARLLLQRLAPRRAPPRLRGSW